MLCVRHVSRQRADRSDRSARPVRVSTCRPPQTGQTAPVPPQKISPPISTNVHGQTSRATVPRNKGETGSHGWLRQLKRPAVFQPYILAASRQKKATAWMCLRKDQLYATAAIPSVSRRAVCRKHSPKANKTSIYCARAFDTAKSSAVKFTGWISAFEYA